MDTENNMIVKNEDSGVSIYVQLVDEKNNNDDKTVLDIYLKQELDSLLEERKKNILGEDVNKLVWKDVKEQLGISLMNRHTELKYHKNKGNLHALVNILLGGALVGLYLWHRK